MHTPPLVLIVDDIPQFLEIFGTKIRGAGFDVETAANGEEGIKKAKELKPDLILMDVKMPVLDGTDAVIRLMNDPDTKNLKVIFLTELGDPREEVQEVNRKFARDIGAIDYMKKSVDLDILLAKVRTYIQ
jgi:CheY-like chemotaxis protein